MRGLRNTDILPPSVTPLSRTIENTIIEPETLGLSPGHPFLQMIIGTEYNEAENRAFTSHHLRPVDHAMLVSKPAFSIRLLMPAPSNKPNTVSRNKVTTSWSRGESRSGDGDQ
jgi:hypothetical protein